MIILQNKDIVKIKTVAIILKILDIENDLKAIGKNLDSQSSKYDNFIALGDFNAERTEIAISDFMKDCHFKKITKDTNLFQKS